MNRNENAHGTAWVVGASSGIGAAVAQLLATRGCRVAISGRRLERLAELAAEQASGTLLPVAVDVTDETSVRRGWEQVVAGLGVPDVVIYAAGLWKQTEPGEWSSQEMGRHLDTNVMGFARVLDHAVPALRDRGSGRLVIVASVAGYRGLSGAEYYGPTKAALINLGESLRASLALDGIGVTTVCPGFVDTEMTAVNDFPMPFTVTAQRAAREIVAGIEAGHDEVVFPRRMAAVMKTARVLPVPAWSAVTKRFAAQVKDD